MKTVRLTGISRTLSTKSANKQLRKKALIPTIFYGYKQDNILLSLSMVEVEALLDTTDPCFIELALDKKTYRCIINDVQYHPVSDMPLHIDLLHISEDRSITLDIPLTFEGKSPGIQKGGELAIKKRTLPIKALPKHMPQKLTVDISHLDLGEKVDVRSIKTDNFTVEAAPQIPLATIMIPRALRSSKAAESATQ